MAQYPQALTLKFNSMSKRFLSRKFAFLLISSGLLATGCSTLPSAPAVFNQSANGQVQFVDFPSERRGAWFVKTDVKTPDGVVTSYKVCAEPPTDTGLSTTQLLNLTADLKKLADTKAGVDSSTNSNLYELKGRTPAVLALRDVMYRMCESRLHKTEHSISDKAEDNKIYAAIVEVISRFAQADLNSAEEQKARAVGQSSKFDNAVAKEKEGITAVGKKEWDTAQKAFAECENIFPQFRACFEFSNDLKNNANKSDKLKAAALLKRETYFPNNIKDMLKTLAQQE
jgi:hypothetical protein